jgi:hypothetical protein
MDDLRSKQTLMIITSLFLAGKVNETPRRLRDVINVVQMVILCSLLEQMLWGDVALINSLTD